MARTQPNRYELLGLNVDSLSFAEVCERIDDRVAAREAGCIFTPNVDHVCTAFRNERFREAYQQPFLRLPDGTPLLWAARLLGKPLREKLSGSDMLPRLAAHAAEKGHSLFFLGGAPGTAEKSARLLCERHPSLKIAGVCCPDYGFEKDAEKLAEVEDALRESQADLCFVALGSPKQEYFIVERCMPLGIPVSIGVGAAFDFLSGRIRRAPHVVQVLGLEWFWRLCLEPKRLWRRYLVDDMVFFKLFWRAYRGRPLRSGADV